MFGLIGVLPPVLLVASNARHWLGEGMAGKEAVFLLLLPTGPWMGWRFGALRGDKRWKRFGMIAGLLTGAGFGHVMEGTEGAVWGGLAGLVVGFCAGLYAPWIANVLPARWGVVGAWSALGIAMVIVPLLIGLKLFFGRLDDDDSAFVLMAACGGVLLAARRGWWENGTIRRTEVMGALKRYGRFWQDRRVWPWTLAFLIPGLATGGFHAIHELSDGPALEVKLLAESWLWPSCLWLAAVRGLAVSRKRRSVPNGAYFLACLAVLVLVSIQLAGMARFRVRVDADSLEIRRGLFPSVRLERGELMRIDTEIARGRRHVVPYPVLVTRENRRHHLRGLPMSHAVETYLRETWRVQVLDAPR